jgi:hypothetical protein
MTILLHDSISAGKTVNLWDSFCSFHEWKIERKSHGRAFEPARFARW